MFAKRQSSKDEQLTKSLKFLLLLTKFRDFMENPDAVVFFNILWFLSWGGTEFRVSIVRYMGDYARICHFRL